MVKNFSKDKNKIYNNKQNQPKKKNVKPQMVKSFSKCKNKIYNKKQNQQKKKMSI